MNWLLLALYLLVGYTETARWWRSKSRQERARLQYELHTVVAGSVGEDQVISDEAALKLALVGRGLLWPYPYFRDLLLPGK